MTQKPTVQIDALALRLCDIAEAMKPERRKKEIPFEPVEIRVICQCLMAWRNREIQAERLGAVDALNELLDTVYQLKRKVAVADGGFSVSGSIQEVIKFRE